MQNVMQNRPRWYVLRQMLAASLAGCALYTVCLLTPAYAEETVGSPSLAARANGGVGLHPTGISGRESVIGGPLAINTCLAGGAQLPPVGAVSPFPVSLRLGLQISP